MLLKVQWNSKYTYHANKLYNNFTLIMPHQGTSCLHTEEERYALHDDATAAFSFGPIRLRRRFPLQKANMKPGGSQAVELLERKPLKEAIEAPPETAAGSGC